MKMSPAIYRRLGIEALETRTLLAGGADPFGLIADFDATMQAVSGTGDFTGSFDKSFGHRQLVLTGSADAVVTIDLDKLPAFVTTLTISSFASVTLVGNDTVEDLIAKDIDTFNASGLTITGQVLATNVDRLTIGTIGAAGEISFLRINGTDTELGVDQIGDNTTVMLDLDTITLSTADDRFEFLNIPGDEITVYLKTYTPGLHVAAPGLDEAHVHVWAPAQDSGSDGTPSDPATPDTPNNPDAPNHPDTPDTNSDPHPGYVVVDMPLDDRTRAFITELRAMLQASNGDPERLIAEFMAGRDPAESALIQAFVADELRRAGWQAVGSGSLFDTPVSAPVAGPAPVEAGSQLPALHLWRGAQPVASELPPVLLDSSVPSLGSPIASFDIGPAFTPITLSAFKESSLDSKAMRVDEDEPTLAESMQALGSYIAGRVAAELSPGEQSFVLMVDPPPPRPAAARKANATRDDEPPESDLLSTEDLG